MSDAAESEPPVEARRPLSEMRLRVSPPRVVTLSKPVVFGLAGVAAIALAGGVFLALRPHSKPVQAELFNTNSKARPDGLAKLPDNYAGSSSNVPVLGPPLPGDLGRPMLNAGVVAPGMGTAAQTPSTPPDPVKQHIAQERDAARESKLFSSSDSAGPAPASPSPPSSSTLATAAAPQPAAASPDAGDHKLAFLNGTIDRKLQTDDRLQAPAAGSVLQAGAVIAAALITGLRSDLPGQISAQVTENVYDSPTGRILLVPQGSKLIGQYDAQISFGQSRALLVWTRLILPNGRSIVLERQPGADPEGHAGLEDQVDNHWGMLFKAAMLSTLLSVGSEAGTSDTENSLVQAIRQGASQSFSQVGQQVVSRSLAVQPTLTIRPGYPVRVLVTHDLVLEPYSA